MLDDVIKELEIKHDGIYLDLTLGRAGHSSKILEKLDEGKLICFDKDKEAIDFSQKKLSQINDRFLLIKRDFRFLKEELEKLKIEKIDGLIADLGVSSPQLDDIKRGFSYSKDSKLDMRMDLDQNLTAFEIVNTWDEEKITKILIENADVKLAKQVAKAIVKNRPIESSFSLNEIVKKSLPAKVVREKNPSKQIFQALRIEVNDELHALIDLLKDIVGFTKEGTKLCFITFHSKEDKIVKNFYQTLVYQDPRLNKLPIKSTKNWKQKIIYPSALEISKNSRSKSAKLRVITRME
ncbi:16S rRNA (cytosine1402-N4)-methyltransferase [Metamycoplasma subdolum]|uniref:Ribosomal RNA small subunit methyltransferase H n=2 Tax=Metamycoplasma subdolum TaxID=92407 RepID=A0A3L9ZZH6_9BACT|nr:16S rRNA (cytosine1402-N4)-methyltransferase [Metamycoplasma subdolum]